MLGHNRFKICNKYSNIGGIKWTYVKHMKQDGVALILVEIIDNKWFILLK